MKATDKDITKRSVWRRLFQRVLTGLTYLALRPRVEWEDESLKEQVGERPFVFVCNHTSHLDGVFAGAVLNRFSPYVLVTKKWYERRGVGRMIGWCRSIPIDLDGVDASWYQTGAQVLRQGYSLIIFPEGGLAREGRMMPFKPGAGLIAATTKTAVVPVAIYGGYHLFFGRRQRVRVGRPISSDCPETMRHSQYARQLMEQAEGDVKRLYGTMEAVYGNIGTYAAESYARPQQMDESVFVHRT